MTGILKFIAYALIYNLVLNYMEPNDQRIKAKMSWFNFVMFVVFILLSMVGCATTMKDCERITIITHDKNMPDHYWSCK